MAAWTCWSNSKAPDVTGKHEATCGSSAASSCPSKRATRLMDNVAWGGATLVRSRLIAKRPAMEQVRTGLEWREVVQLGVLGGDRGGTARSGCARWLTARSHEVWRGPGTGDRWAVRRSATWVWLVGVTRCGGALGYAKGRATAEASQDSTGLGPRAAPARAGQRGKRAEGEEGKRSSEGDREGVTAWGREKKEERKP